MEPDKAVGKAQKEGARMEVFGVNRFVKNVSGGNSLFK